MTLRGWLRFSFFSCAYSLSHSTCLSLHLLRQLVLVLWLMSGLIYAGALTLAEIRISDVLNGKPRSPVQMLSDINFALSAFPFHRHMRNLRNEYAKSSNDPKQIRSVVLNSHQEIYK